MNAGAHSSVLADSVRAHALLFEIPLRPRHDVAAGTRILLAFVVVAVGVFYGLRMALSAAGIAGASPGRLAFVAILLLPPTREGDQLHPSAFR